MEASKTLSHLRDRARDRFGPDRAGELDSVLIEVAKDLDILAEFDLDPDDSP